MNNEFGLRLRGLRKAKGLSQSVLAERSGISLRAVSYWESGQRLPRVPELQATLRGLEAAPHEAARLIELLTTPSGQRFAVETRIEETKTFSSEAVPGIGDLLRAMRTRRRITQEQLAERLRVNRRAVLRWETGQTTITGDNMERLCVLLGAAPEEQAVLREGRLTLTPRGGRELQKVSVEEAAQIWSEIQRGHDPTQTHYRPHSPLMELNTLAMKRHLRMNAAPDAGARRLLARIESDYAMWTYYQGNAGAAKQSVARVMGLIEAETAPEAFWADSLNLAGSFVMHTKQGIAGSLRLLEKWAARLPAGFVRTTQVCDMALYAILNGEQSQAFALLKAAERSLNRTGGASEWERFYHQITRERLLHLSGRSSEIIEELLTLAPNNFQRVHLMIRWSRFLRTHNEKNAAEHYLNRAQALSSQDVPTQLRRELAEQRAAF